MYLVVKSKWDDNLLAFEEETSEYVYFHENKEIWREKGDKTLLDLFCCDLLDEEKINSNKIYQKYAKSCESF